MKLIVPGMKYSRVDRSPKFTAVSLENYSIAEGFVSRSFNTSTVIGYLAQEPKHVLAQLMPSIHVTSYQGIKLFTTSDINGAPRVGLGINAVDPETPYGMEINGDLIGIYETKKMDPARMESGLSREEYKIIKNNLEKILYDSKFYKDHKITAARVKEISFALERALISGI